MGGIDLLRDGVRCRGTRERGYEKHPCKGGPSPYPHERWLPKKGPAVTVHNGATTTAALRPVVAEPITRPTRRARSDRAILEAARVLLDENGVRGLTIERVAERSGVAKTTIYRRWRDRDELALAVLIEMSEDFRAPPDLGDTRKELLAFVKEATGVIELGGVIPGLASEIARGSSTSGSRR